MRFFLPARGFSYPELLIVVTIIMLVFMLFFPAYKRYSAWSALQKTADRVQEQLRKAHNRAVTGVTAQNGSVAHWVVRLYSSVSLKQFETGACPVITDSSVSGYENRYVFSLCPNRSHFEVFQFPEHFFIAFRGYTVDDISIFFSSIHGTVKVYDRNGAYLGDSVDIEISSLEEASMSIIVRVNSNGVVSAERVVR